jgi:hypothetical protein
MENGAKVLTFIQLRKSALFYVWLWMSGGAATEKSGCAVKQKNLLFLFFLCNFAADEKKKLLVAIPYYIM